LRFTRSLNLVVFASSVLKLDNRSSIIFIGFLLNPENVTKA
jgi:hypothetical protein